MSNPMDRMQFNQVQINNPVVQNNTSIQKQYADAMRNPRAFNDYVARTNPQAYQKAMQIARSVNPQQVVIQMLQERGLVPGMFNLPGLR